MRKVVLMGSAKTVCTDFAELVEFPDDVTEEQLDEAAWEASIENAERYGWSYTGSDELLDEDEYDDFITDSELNYYWQDYDPEKHDGLL
jgi:hypothetical protein